MKGASLLVFVVLIAGCIVCTGCMSPGSPASSPVVAPSTSRMETQTTTTIPEVLPTTPAVPATAAAVTGTSQMPATPAREYFTNINTLDNPWMQNLEFSKNYYPFAIPDCGMKVVFPQAALDPHYGILQPVPKLIALSPDQMATFLQKYREEYNGDPSRIGGAACAGASANPGWNFIKIVGTIIPRNARPDTYDMRMNVRSQGKVIAQFRINETLTLGQPFSFERYVPLKTNEMDLFDSVELLFARKT
jgi:hypothetical protein